MVEGRLAVFFDVGAVSTCLGSVVAFCLGIGWAEKSFFISLGSGIWKALVARHLDITAPIKFIRCSAHAP